MSTEVTADNVDELEQAIADVRTDDTETNWALFGHVDGNPNYICFLAAGSNGVEEFAENLDDSQVLYGLLRVTETIDMSQTTKFVYVRFLGPEVSFSKKGKYGVVSGSVDKIFSPYQLTMEIEAKDEISEELVMKRITETSGTSNKVLDAAEAKTRPERGFTTGSSRRGGSPTSPTAPVSLGKIGKQGSSFSGFTPQAKGGSGLKVDDAVRSTIAAVRSDTDEMAWCVVTFENQSIKNPLVVVNSGEDITEVQSNFSNDGVYLALLRVTDIVDDIPTAKFVYIMYMGENVKPLVKGKIPTLKGVLDELFNPFHIFIHGTNPSEVRTQVVLDKVGAASGSKSHVK